jgi:hypothetical protein
MADGDARDEQKICRLTTTNMGSAGSIGNHIVLYVSGTDLAEGGGEGKEKEKEREKDGRRAFV